MIAALLGMFTIEVQPLAAQTSRFLRYFAAVSCSDVDTTLIEKFVFTMMLSGTEGEPKTGRGLQPS